MIAFLFIWALCPMCQASLENSQDAAGLSAPVNDAVLVLFIPILVIIGGLARLVFKYRHSQIETHDNLGSPHTQRDLE